MAAFVLYFLLSILLFKLGLIDIRIPCLITMVTGKECWGCGTTRAATAMLQLDFVTAWKFNKLSFITIPAIGILLVTDFVRFYRKQKNQKEN